MNPKVIHETLDELLRIAAAGSSPNISKSERQALERLYEQQCARLRSSTGPKKTKRGTPGDFIFPI
jgi:hypothetical protein